MGQNAKIILSQRLLFPISMRTDFIKGKGEVAFIEYLYLTGILQSLFLFVILYIL